MNNQDPKQPENSQRPDDYDHLHGEGMEALTLEELDEFMKRAKERAANFREVDRSVLRDAPPTEEETPAEIDPARLARLAQNFFPELPELPRSRRLVQGIIFDFDNTLARLKRPIDELMREGAKTAESYMRATGMDDLPEEFWESIVEARIFAQTKSDDEQEEHIAEDTLSFLLQFFGYPASKMDPDVLHRAVDLFYAPEMTSWEAMPSAKDLLRRLHDEGYKLAIIANYSCDRVFQRIVDYTGLRPYLDSSLSSAAVEWRKPGRDIYDIVLKRWDAEPYEIVCVGDSLKHDIAGGIDLGAQTIHCRMIPLAEDQRIVETVHPDAVVEDLSEIPALIHAWS
jgi:FMN phosphatase YigB (HAD superfamily)